MITIVGAGFSGLSLAFHLRKHGLKVRVMEKESRVGGLLGTRESEYGLAETAANALLCDLEIERLFEDLGIAFAERRPERKKRYIFWEKPTRWPLTWVTSARLAWVVGQIRLGAEDVLPRAGETIHEWSRRVVNAEFEERLLTPALRGVFAGDPKVMSARLTLNALFQGRAPAGKFKGSVAPVRGMNQLVQALRTKLESDGVEFRLGHEFKLGETKGPVVLCTSAWTAAEITAESHPKLSDDLRHCESLPLISATAIFEPSAQDLQGFGCLFAPGQGFQASGVLFNNCIFEGRTEKPTGQRSETWIFGGALNLGVSTWTDFELRDHLLRDRARLMPGSNSNLLDLTLNRWPRAIPHYTVQWEKFLKQLRVEKPLYLHGNYLGAIGLASIHRRSIELAKELKDEYGT